MTFLITIVLAVIFGLFALFSAAVVGTLVDVDNPTELPANKRNSAIFISGVMALFFVASVVLFVLAGGGA